MESFMGSLECQRGNRQLNLIVEFTMVKGERVEKLEDQFQIFVLTQVRYPEKV